MAVLLPRGDRRRCAVRHSPLLLLLSGLALGFTPTPAILAEHAQAIGLEVDGPYAAEIAEAARLYGIPEAWVRAVLAAESDGDPLAVSSAGALGLMQLMPATWGDLRAAHQLGDDPFHPRDNIRAGTAYLRAMWDRYGNIGGMLAAYNAGPGRYDEYRETGRELPAETRAYIAALVPLLGGEPLATGRHTVPSGVTDWRAASLFVAVSGGSDPAPAPQDDGSASTTSDAPLLPRNPLAPASPATLFVARSVSEDAP